MSNFSNLGQTLKAVLWGRKDEGHDPTLPPIHPGAKVEMDIAPFVLAAEVLKMKPPAAVVTVDAVSRLSLGVVHWQRVHFEAGFIMLGIADSGEVRECRVFTRHDQIFPGSVEDWAFWLDEEDGYIGYPSFQLPDGTTYARHWAPGHEHVEPCAMIEDMARVATGQPRQVTHQAMLYARPTGQAEPSPVAEFLMVDAVRDGDTALVEIWIGIDMNPGAFRFL